MPTAVETHSQFVKARAGAFAQNLLPAAAGPVPISLNVRNGLHCGSLLELKTGTFSIGPTCRTDVMLLDDEALGEDANFTTTTSIFGPILTVVTERDDLCLNGVPVQPNVISQPCKLPCTVDFNGITFVLRSAQEPRPRMAQRAERVLLPLLLTMATAAFGAQIYLTNQPAPTLAFDPQPTKLQHDPVLRLDSSEDRVRDLIIQAGLDSRLDVKRDGSDMLSISGDLPPNLLPAWRDIRGQVDQVAGGVAVATNVKAGPGISEMPAIAAVVLDGEPRVHLANGTVLRSGDPISGEWVIRDIAVNAIEVERGSDTLIVSF